MTMTLSVTTALLSIFVGWGIGDLSGFFSDWDRALLCMLIVASGTIMVALHVDMDPLRRGRLPVGNQSLTLVTLAIFSIMLVLFLPFADRRKILLLGADGGLRHIGLILCATGITIRIFAMRQLGNEFSAYVTLQENHRLVTSGIYRVIRHPLYLSLLLAGPGFALLFKSILVIPIILVAMIFVSLRIHQEENLLESEFGAAFLEYRKHTWALIPLII